jgi:hypothetical protein
LIKQPDHVTEQPRCYKLVHLVANPLLLQGDDGAAADPRAIYNFQGRRRIVFDQDGPRALPDCLYDALSASQYRPQKEHRFSDQRHTVVDTGSEPMGRGLADDELSDSTTRETETHQGCTPNNWYRTTGKYSNPASFPQDVCLNFRWRKVDENVYFFYHKGVP